MAEDDQLLVIAPGGDLILDLSQEEGGQQFAYRVDSQALRSSSRYFENLLSDRFSEGQKLITAMAALKIAGHLDLAGAPTDALPRISIVNVGRIAISKESNIRNLAADFLRAIHGQELAVPTPPVPNLANLAVVADRFDAVSDLAAYVQRRKYMQIVDAKSKGKTNSSVSEERARQKLLVGLMFDHPPWVTRYSKHLIMRDSDRWRPDAKEDFTKALWWDLPNGLEDELIQRREYILETINSLQAHFLRLYTSGERQCKMGYDTSLQCDSFQLGEMIRFFSRLGTLRLQGTIYDNTEPTYYSGDVGKLLESIRQCSSYQIDQHHSHCGLRTRIMPPLDLIQSQLSLDTSSIDIGICAECWANNRTVYAWALTKRPVLWTYPKGLTGSRMLSMVANPSTKGHQRRLGHCLGRHSEVREMFTAKERIWTTKDVY